MSTRTPSARMWSISVWDVLCCQESLRRADCLLEPTFRRVCEASGHLETLAFRERAYSLVTAFRDPRPVAKAEFTGWLR